MEGLKELVDTIYIDLANHFYKVYSEQINTYINNRKAELKDEAMDTIRRREVNAIIAEFDKLLSIFNH